MTCVRAAGGCAGQKGASSVPEGGCSFTFMDCGERSKALRDLCGGCARLKGVSSEPPPPWLQLWLWGCACA